MPGSATKAGLSMIIRRELFLAPAFYIYGRREMTNHVQLSRFSLALPFFLPQFRRHSWSSLPTEPVLYRLCLHITREPLFLRPRQHRICPNSWSSPILPSSLPLCHAVVDDILAKLRPIIGICRPAVKALCSIFK